MVEDHGLAPSAPSQMCMGRGAGNQQNWVCYEHVRKRQMSGPRVTPGMGGRIGGLSDCTVLCGAKKSTGVEPPSAPSLEWPGRGTRTEPLVLLMERSDVIVLCSKS